MSRGDGSGPLGMGPMTGRGRGSCINYAVPGFFDRLRGGFFGRGGGRGFRNMYWAAGLPGWMRFPGLNAFSNQGPPMMTPDNPETEAFLLEKQIRLMEQSLEEAKIALVELKKENDRG